MSYLVVSLLAVVPVLIGACGATLYFRGPYEARLGVRRVVEQQSWHARLRRTWGRAVLSVPVRPVGVFAESVHTWVVRAGEPRREGARVAELLAGTAAFAAVLGLLVLVLGHPGMGLLLVLVGVLAPALQLRTAAARRQAQIERAVPGLLELMATLIRAGLTFRHALARVTERTTGALGEEMRVLLVQLDFGWSPEQALADLVHRSSAPTMVRLSVTARQSLTLGAPIASALLALADDARLTYVVRLRQRAEQLVVRGIVLLVALTLLPFAGLLVTVVLAVGLEQLQEIGRVVQR